LHGGIDSIPACSVLASGDPVRYIFSFPQTPVEFAKIRRDLTVISEEQSMTLTKAQIVEGLFAHFRKVSVGPDHRDPLRVDKTVLAKR
jgi:hypothetical protein